MIQALALFFIFAKILTAYSLEEKVDDRFMAEGGSIPLRRHPIMMLNPEKKTAASTAAPVTAKKSQTTKEYQDDINTLDMQAIMNECNETFRTEIEYIDSLNDVGSFPDETDKTPKCYVRCMLEKAGVATAEGEFVAARAADLFGGERGGRPMEAVEELAAACAVRGETCKCERSYNFAKCLIESEIVKYGARD